MSHNQLSDEGLGMLGEGLAANTGIEEIQFTHNDLSQPNGSVFIKALKNMAHNQRQVNAQAAKQMNRQLQ